MEVLQRNQTGGGHLGDIGAGKVKPNQGKGRSSMELNSWLAVGSHLVKLTEVNQRAMYLFVELKTYPLVSTGAAPSPSPSGACLEDFFQ